MTTSFPTSARRGEACTASRQDTRDLSERRARLLHHAMAVLAAASAGSGEALARSCREVLDDPDVDPAPDRGPGGVQATMPVPPPLAAPGWADTSVAEDGGVIHETVSPLHPTVRLRGPNGSDLAPTDVALSVTDLLIDGRWIRTQPTDQVEGGSYSLDGARQLQSAVGALLTLTDVEAPAPDD